MYEVRLPITDQDIQFTGLSFDGKNIEIEKQLEVKIRPVTLNKSHYWKGKIIRTEAETDNRTKMMVLVASFDVNNNKENYLLTIGQFVEATIKGIKHDNIISVSRSRVRDNLVWVVNKSNQLKKRLVQIWRYEEELAYIRSGFYQGDQLLTSRLSTLIEGMEVKILIQKDQ